jgi:predicted NBD/HSP70 family sugar kinase
VILGGGMLSRTPVLREHAVAALEVAVNPPALTNLTITDATLGDDAGPIGAALLALR